MLRKPTGVEVGITLLASSPIAWFLAVALLWVPPELYASLYLAGSIAELTYNLIRYGPFCVLTSAGLILYISGRKRFWEDLHKRQGRSGLLVALGLFLIIGGLLFSFWSYDSIMYYTNKPPGRQFDQLLVASFPALLWYLLWFVSGIPLLADSLKARKLNEATHQRNP